MQRAFDHTSAVVRMHRAESNFFLSHGYLRIRLRGAAYFILEPAKDVLVQQAHFLVDFRVRFEIMSNIQVFHS